MGHGKHSSSRGHRAARPRAERLRQGWSRRRQDPPARRTTRPRLKPPSPSKSPSPSRGEMLAMYSGTATLEAEADAEVIAKVGGEVRRIFVEEGDHVRAGQVLAQLDDRQLRLQAAQTRAARGQGRARFQSPGGAARQGTGVGRRFRRSQVRPRQPGRRRRHRPAQPLVQRDPRAVRRHRLDPPRQARPGNRGRHQHVPRHRSHAAQGQCVRARARTRAAQARPVRHRSPSTPSPAAASPPR